MGILIEPMTMPTETHRPIEPQRPIFVVGQGRSGTTLLAAMLNAHPRLACGPETSFFDLAGGRRGRRLVEDPRWPAKAIDFVTSMRRAGTHLVIDDYGLTHEQVALALDGRPASLGAILESLTVPYAESRGKARWAEKTPRHLLHVRRIREQWPDADIVRIVRDPRAVAASYLRVPFGPSSAVAAAYLWRDGDDRSWRRLADDPRSMTLRYEDLVAHPDAATRALCAFLGEAFDAAMLRQHETDVDAVTAGSRWKRRVAEPIDTTRIDAWRTELSASDQLRVERIAADGMQRHGYAPTAETAGTDGIARRSQRRSVSARPMDAAFLRDATALLESAADQGITVGSAARSWRSGDGPLLLWGSRGTLRWIGGGRVTSLRAVARWSVALAAARLRRRPALWVDRPTDRRASRAVFEQVMDRIVRVTTIRVTPEEALERLINDSHHSSR